MRQTTNYKLPSWDSEDRILRTDFNDLTEKVDTALAENAQAVSDEANARMAAINDLAMTRNCRLMTMNYTGNGKTTRIFAFSGKPLLVNIMGMNHWVCAVYDASIASGRYLEGGGGQKLNASWNMNSVTISSPNSDASYMCNWTGEAYCLVALVEV